MVPTASSKFGIKSMLKVMINEISLASFKKKIVHSLFPHILFSKRLYSHFTYCNYWKMSQLSGTFGHVIDPLGMFREDLKSRSL